MTKLILEPNIPDFDAVYERLIELHSGRSDEDSHSINARLVLIFANHIGDEGVIAEAFELAGQLPSTGENAG
jgi:hypothetical protein